MFWQRFSVSRGIHRCTTLTTRRRWSVWYISWVSKVVFCTSQYSTLYSFMIKKRYTKVVSIRSYDYLDTASIYMTVGYNKNLILFLLVKCLNVYLKLFEMNWIIQPLFKVIDTYNIKTTLKGYICILELQNQINI